MADVKWIKITTNIFNDEKIMLIESLPESDAIIVIWFKLLCLAGKQNNSGVFQMTNGLPYSEEMFASVFRKPVNTIRLALKTFQMYGMIEIINDVVTLPNWEKYQSLDALEKKKEYDRKYQANRRQQQKLLIGENSRTIINDKKTTIGVLDKEIDIEEEKEIYKKENKKEKSLSDGDSKYLEAYSRFLKKKYPDLSNEEIIETEEYQNQYERIIAHY